MLIYNISQLDNRLIGQDTDAALAEGIIAAETADKIKAAHPCKLYEPNIFVRVGLIIVTVLCVLLAMGFVALLAADGVFRSFGTFCFVWGLLTYGALELWMKERPHFRSGVDDGLTWMTAGLIGTGLYWWLEDASLNVPFYGLMALVGSWLVVRTADAVVAACVWICGILFVMYTAIGYVPGARYLLPFLLMGYSAAGYFLFSRMQQQFRFRHYDLCLSVLRFAGLATFYAAGNYYIVHNLGMNLLGMEGEPPLPWLFWTLSVALPPAYVWMGLRKKDRIPLATGLLLMAAAVFTVRAYHAVMPIETAMLLGGIGLAGISYFVHRYLKTPKHGFTTQATHTRSFGAEQLEGLIIAETMQPAPQSEGSFRFGGGSGGGGGAGGEF